LLLVILFTNSVKLCVYQDLNKIVATYQLGAYAPKIDVSSYIAHNASVIGQVILEANTSVWDFAALRGDNEIISIGQNSNIQECAVLHTDMGSPLTIGQNCTIGHQAMLHGCTIKDGCLIGIQAVVLNGAIIGENSLVGAGALVTEKKEFPPRSLILGSPAKFIRTLTEDEIQRFLTGITTYIEKAQKFKNQLIRLA
jgi:carbonic anhydrase/acetyltransferase-like protein (isoleucine patch superfamily)